MATAFTFRPANLADALLLQVQLSVVDDGTLAIEATVHQLLAQWPYMSNLSLIWTTAFGLQPTNGTDVLLLQVQLSVVDDGTLAIEATVHQLLAQWPYLSDLSLIWATASIFEPTNPADVSGPDADPAHQAAAAAAHKILQEPAVQPWLYFNLIAHNSHIFAPVMDLVMTLGLLLPAFL